MSLRVVLSGSETCQTAEIEQVDGDVRLSSFGEQVYLCPAAALRVHAWLGEYLTRRKTHALPDSGHDNRPVRK